MNRNDAPMVRALFSISAVAAAALAVTACAPELSEDEIFERYAARGSLQGACQSVSDLCDNDGRGCVAYDNYCATRATASCRARQRKHSGSDGGAARRSDGGRTRISSSYRHHDGGRSWSRGDGGRTRTRGDGGSTKTRADSGRSGSRSSCRPSKADICKKILSRLGCSSSSSSSSSSTSRSRTTTSRRGGSSSRTSGSRHQWRRGVLQRICRIAQRLCATKKSSGSTRTRRSDAGPSRSDGRH